MNSQESSNVRIVREVNDQAHPRTVRELVRLVRVRDPRVSEEQVVAAVEALRSTGQLVLEPRVFSDFAGFFFNLQGNLSFWIFVLISLLTGVSLSAQLGLPWGLIRLPLVLPLLFYFPGRGLLRLFPRESEFSGAEKILLEFGSSIVLVLLTGLFLDFSGLGFFSLPALSSIFLLDLAMMMVASYRDYLAIHTVRGRASVRVPSSAP
jgi:uncharacterized membrane protein